MVVPSQATEMALLTEMVPRKLPVLAFDRVTADGLLSEATTPVESSAKEDAKPENRRQEAKARTHAAEGKSDCLRRKTPPEWKC